MKLFDALFGRDELVTYEAEYEELNGDEGVIVEQVVTVHECRGQRDIVQKLRDYETKDSGREPDRLIIKSRTW